MNKKSIIVSLAFFFIINLFSLVYFISSKKYQESFYIEYNILYDKNFVDDNFYSLNIEPQLPVSDYKRGIYSYTYCITRSECKRLIKTINKKILQINNKLWNVTESMNQNFEKLEVDKKFRLRFEYLKTQNQPRLIMLNYKIIENGVNVLFTNLFRVAVSTFILSSILFMALNFFSSRKRNKK